MKIITLTDLHGNLEFISYITEELKEADFIFLSGDVTHFGKAEQAKSMIETIKLYNDKILAIPGNCDYPDVNKYFVEIGISIDCRYIISNGLFIMGVGGSLPCPGKTPLEFSEEEFATFYQETVKNNTKGLPIVLIAHQPPFNTLNDQLLDGFHVGSHSVRVFIEKYQPLICFCGHIHEAAGKDKIGQTTVINPGPFGMGGYTRSMIFKDEVNAEIVNVFTRK